MMLHASEVFVVVHMAWVVIPGVVIPKVCAHFRTFLLSVLMTVWVHSSTHGTKDIQTEAPPRPALAGV